MMKLKPYPEYRDSGVEWLGKVPAHWPLERAKWLFSRMQRPVRPQDEVVTCFRDGIVTLRKNRRTEGFTESLKEIGYQGVREGDLVIHGMDGFAGAIGVSDSDGKCTPVYSICQPKGDTCVEYYAFIAREMARTQWILALARGIRERSTDFRFGTFAGQFILVPPREEQDLIVGFLSAQLRLMDRFIRNKGRLIKLLQEQKQAVINDCVTGKMEVRRIVDENGSSSFRLQPSSCKMRDSGIDWLGEIPEHWEVLPFTKYTIERADYRGATPEKVDSGRFLVTAKNIRMGFIDYECSKEYVPEDQYTHIMRRGFPKKGDLLLTTEAPLGHASLVDREDVAFAQRVIRFRLNSEYLRPKFTLLSILSQYFQNQLLCRATGSTVSGIKASKLPQLRILAPPMEEQKVIQRKVAENTAIIDAAISQVQRQIDLIQEYRTRLIADVVTGKVDVRGIPVEDVAED